MDGGDILFRAVNVAGFAANAISLCLPYGSDIRLLLKQTSQTCNALSIGILFSAMYYYKANLTNLLPFAATCLSMDADTALINASHSAATEFLPERFVDEGTSITTQFLNICYGIHQHTDKNGNKRNEIKSGFSKLFERFYS